jgi:hypothetical protein
MRMRFPVAAALLAVSAGMALFAPGVYAQKASEGAKPPAQKKPPPPPQWKPPKPPKQPPPNPAVELRRFLDMKPEQRQKELAKLPPPRRERFEEQISRFEGLPPEQRERQLQRLEALQNLTPERRQAVNQEIQKIRESLPSPGVERRQQLYQHLNNEDFKQRFSPEEQALIRGAFPAMQPQRE